jgi:hypothetical protein
MKRKLLLQQQASTSSETELFRKQKKAEYDKQYKLKHSTRAHTTNWNSQMPQNNYFNEVF